MAEVKLNEQAQRAFDVASYQFKAGRMDFVKMVLAHYRIETCIRCYL